ncbi:hypothetical protein [Rhizobium sp. CC-YZS058]|uniref:hypothetical protein n=1 Tax=Rhizobium sp. CC-YZS058 TaxID=3042153 RepID=UPI002B059F19|nr:hypothetical protein [Rhizobium sp. CC-YZS058]MEA3535358.1 hypothetical protein [Rhizobium sp. CC-YZS058]
MTGVLDSLGKAARHNYILIAECRGMGQPCGRRSSFLPGDLAEIYGAGRDPHRLRFHCSECGSKRVKIILIKPDERNRDVIVKRPRKRQVVEWVEMRYRIF